MIGLTLADAVITEVFVREDRAVFCEVDLQRHVVSSSKPLHAQVKLASDYHGDDYGAWHLPQVGEHVLCAFPGVNPDGSTGDLDSGYIIAFLPRKTNADTGTDFSPTVENEATAAEDPSRLVAGWRIFRGREGESLDQYLRGEVLVRIAGLVTATLEDGLTTDVSGDEQRNTDGDYTRDVTGTYRLDAESIEAVAAATAKLLAPEVKLGIEAAAKKLIHEDFIPLYNAHEHDNVDEPPKSQYLASTALHATQNVEAS